MNHPHFCDQRYSCKLCGRPEPHREPLAISPVDAQAAAEEYFDKTHQPLFDFDMDDMKKSHIAGQSIGEARRTREICEWLRSEEGFIRLVHEMGCNSPNDYASEIQKRFGGK